MEVFLKDFTETDNRDVRGVPIRLESFLAL